MLSPETEVAPVSTNFGTDSYALLVVLGYSRLLWLRFFVRKDPSRGGWSPTALLGPFPALRRGHLVTDAP